MKLKIIGIIILFSVISIPNVFAINTVIKTDSDWSCNFGYYPNYHNSTTGITTCLPFPLVNSTGSVLSNLNKTNCVGDYDLKLYHNGTNEYVIDSCGIVKQHGIYKQSDTDMLSTALSNLKSGHLVIGKGQYHLTNKIFNIQPSVTITGDNWDNISYDENHGTTILVGNGSTIIGNSLDYFKFLDIDCTTKTDSTECFVIYPSSKGTLDHIYIHGSSKSTSLHLSGQSDGKVIAGWQFNDVIASGGLWGVRMDSATNNVFNNFFINGFKGVGLALINCDNNLFIKTMINGYGNSSNTDVMFGGDATPSTGDNIFDQLTVSVGDTNFVSNAVFNTTNSKDIRPNHIYMVSIDGCVKTTYNNHSYGQIDIEHTAYPACNGK